MSEKAINFPQPATQTKEEAILDQLGIYFSIMQQVGTTFIESYNSITLENIKKVDTKKLLEICPAALVLWDRYTEDADAIAATLQRNLDAVQKLGSIINGEITLASDDLDKTE